MSKDIRISRGRWAQAEACRWLRSQGFKIVQENIRFPRIYRAGEVDVLAKRGADLWIVEVKARRAAGLGATSAPLLSWAQRTRLLRSAHLLRRSYSWARLRFSLLWVKGEIEEGGSEIEFFENPC